VLSPDAPECDDSTYDALVTLSTSLLTASDNLISSIYAPQQLPNVSAYLQFLREAIKDLQRTIFPQPRSDKSRKWFRTCFEQIEILGAKVVETLGPVP